MSKRPRYRGSVLLLAIFAVALLAAVTTGMLQLNTEETQLVRNHIGAAEALATAEAGLNDAFSQLRNDPNWTAGFVDKAFNGGSYTVDVNSLTVTSTGTSRQGFVGRIEAEITVGSASPYIIRIDRLRINGQ